MFFGASRLARGSGSVTGITFVGSTLLNSVTSGSYPGGTQAGDIAVVFDQNHRGSSGSPETPPPATNYSPGFSLLLNQVYSSGVAVQNFRVVLSYKILTSSDVSSGISNLMGNNETSWLVVFRPNAPTSSLIFSTPSCEITSGTPTTQTIACNNVSAPVIALAWFVTQEDVISPRTSSVTMTEIDDSTTVNPHRSYIKYKIYNMADATNNITVDMDDETTTTDLKNILTSFYLKVL